MLSRLYAILDVDLTSARGLLPLDVIEAWLTAGVSLIQLRAKTLAAGPMLDLADAIRERTATAKATFIVNDRADVARMCGAAGVHVGQDDLTPSDARRVVGDQAIVGVSTHSAEQLVTALIEPVDYVAIGPVFGTSSKARPDPIVGLDGVSLAASLAGPTDRPVVAIGGITLEHAASVIDAGASSVAVISDLLSGDIERRARAFLETLR